MISNAGKRCAEIVTQAVADGHRGLWVAIRLSDGGSDGVIYFSRAGAITHQLHETLCAYVQVPWDGMSGAEADLYLAFHRRCYDAGFRLSDPSDPEPVMPANLEELR